MSGAQLVSNPVVILFAGVFLTYLVDVVTAGETPQTLGLLASGVFVAALASVWHLGSQTLPVTYRLVGADPELRVTALGLFLAVVAVGLGLVVAVYTVHGRDDAGDDVYYPLLLALVAGVVGVGFAADLFTLYVFFEVMAVASYGLVPFRVDRPEAVEAGFKYLVMNVVGSLLAVFGVAVVFAVGGTLDLVALRDALAGAGNATLAPLSIALVLVVVGFGVKAALVPLHSWLPDAYAESPTAVSALLAGLATPAAVVAMVICVTVFPATLPVGTLLLVFAILTMTAGNVLALRQRDVKRLLAYSSIPHVGYIVFGLGVGFHYGFDLAFDGALFHLLANALMKGGAFLGVGALLYQFRSVGFENVRTLEDIRGVGYRMPYASVAVAVAALALAGVPPLAGFWGKLFIVLGGASAVGWVGVALALAVVGNSFLSLGYYLPLVRTLFADPGENAALAEVERAPTLVAVPLVAVTALTVGLGLAPSLGLDVVHPAAELLQHATGGVP